MKRKIRYGFLTLVGLSGILLTLWFRFGIFTPYNAWTAKRDLKNGVVQIVTAGKPFPPEVEGKLASKYGFSLKNLGCTAGLEAVGSEQYNAVVRQYLEDKNGQGFWQKCDDERWQGLEDYYTAYRTEKVIALIEQQPTVKEKTKLVDSLSKGSRHISILPMLQDSAKNVYLVKVGENNGVNFVSYFNFLVDANTMKVLNPNGELE